MVSETEATPTEQAPLSPAMQTVAINGAYNASRALSKWLRRGVRLTSEGFRSVPIGEASSILGEPDDTIAAIRVPLTGDISGDLLLMLPEQVALSLVDILMQQPEGTSTQLGELEVSCLQETGNIVGSAYANSLAKWLKLQIEPRVPVFLQDMASSVIDPLLVTQAAYHDEVLLAMTDFLLDEQRMQWGLLLLPSEGSLRAMQARCELDVVRRRALQTIAVNGSFNASRAMSKWLKRGVKITTEGFMHVALKDVTKELDESKPVVAVHLSLSEPLHGHALLTIEKDHAGRLAALLMGQDVDTEGEFGEIEQSCLEETGNIIVSSFVNSWATWLDINLEPGTPQFVIDLPGAVLEAVVAEQALVGDDVLLTRTDFIVDEHWLELVFMLLPAPSAMRLIETACQ